MLTGRHPAGAHHPICTPNSALKLARDALVHLNAIGRSVAGVSERPDPRGDSNRRAGTVTTQRVWRVMTMRENSRPSEQAGSTTHPPSPPTRHGPQRAMAETTLNKKMRAFNDEVALTVAPFYLIHMLQLKKTPRARPRRGRGRRTGARTWTY